MYTAILNLYRRGRIGKAGVADAVTKGLLTKEQYKEIIGETYTE